MNKKKLAFAIKETICKKKKETIGQELQTLENWFF